MSSYTPHFPQLMRTKVELPASKSLSNRAMLLHALGGSQADMKHVATCDDTFVMWRALHDRPETVDIMAAGTAMRFLTAYLALCPGETHVITGTERMRQRPVAVLVDALRQLGADIDYTDAEGFPPLRIRGRELDGGELELPADVSSQYVSALLMAAPRMKQGLTLHLRGCVMSRPYIDMTLAMMRKAGATVQWTDPQTLRAEPGGYGADRVFEVESDWSAASYWYEMVALTEDTHARVELTRLQHHSMQGDSAVRELFVPLGVVTTFDEAHDSVVLTRQELPARMQAERYEADMSNVPDLAQTLAVTCAMLRRPFRLTGLQTLRIKETDRLEALRNELSKLGIAALIEGDEALSVESYPDRCPVWNGVPIATYHDHRMAMAFAPAALRVPGLTIADPEVVSKSYPAFWRDLEALGEDNEDDLLVEEAP